MLHCDVLLFEAGSGWDRPFPTLDAPEQTFVLVFGESDGAALSGIADLRHAYGRAAMVGCSTAGEIAGGRVLDNSLVAVVCRFESTRVRVAGAHVAGASRSRAAGVELAHALAAPDMRGVLVLSDGLAVNGSQLSAGLNSVLGPDVVITGGLAGDGSRFARTWVLHGGEIVSGWVTGVGFYGDAIHIGYGSKGGWDIFGVDRTVTRSEDNVLYELDGRPALDLYKQYLGERASGLPFTALLFPLTISAPDDTSPWMVRTVLSVNEEDRSLTFAGDIPTGWRARLMRANLDRLVDGAADAAKHAGHAGESGLLSVAISCVGRRLILGERTEEEVEAVLQALPPASTLVGFYSYGELSPLANGWCDLHNQTMTLTTFSES